MSEDLSSALPGFEELVQPKTDRGGSIDLRAAKYTALTVMRDYPGTFRAAARALFKYNLPNRVVRDLFHMNGETVKGIRDLVMRSAAGSTRGDFLTKCRAASSKNLVILRLLDVLQEKLEDPDVVADMKPSEILSLLDRMEPHTPAKKERDDGIIDIVPERATVSFDDVIDGLAAENPRARLVPPAESSAPAPETAAECSTTNDPSGCGSFQQICAPTENIGFEETLSNSLSNQPEDAVSQGLEPSADRPSAVPAAESPVDPGGKGHPGAGDPRGVRALGGVT